MCMDYFSTTLKQLSVLFSGIADSTKSTLNIQPDFIQALADKGAGTYRATYTVIMYSSPNRPYCRAYIHMRIYAKFVVSV